VDEHRLLVALALTRAGAGDAQGARGALSRAEGVAASDDGVLRTERLRAQALIHARSGRWRQAAEVATEAAAEAMALGLSYEAALAEVARAQAWIQLEELPRANEALEMALQLAEEVGAPRVVGQARMLACYAAALITEDPDLAPIQEFLDLSEAEEWTIDALMARFYLGKLAARRGDLVAARRYWTQAVESATVTDNRVLADEFQTELSSLGK
jgi:tetratricopeptide (TPR) repeat protein